MSAKPPFPDPFISDCMTAKVLQNHLTIHKRPDMNKLSLKVARELFTWLGGAICYLEFNEKQALKFNEDLIQRRDL